MFIHPTMIQYWSPPADTDREINCNVHLRPGDTPCSRYTRLPFSTPGTRSPLGVSGWPATGTGSFLLVTLLTAWFAPSWEETHDILGEPVGSKIMLPRCGPLLGVGGRPPPEGVKTPHHGGRAGLGERAWWLARASCSPGVTSAQGISVCTLSVDFVCPSVCM
jgi:hypothetical protein